MNAPTSENEIAGALFAGPGDTRALCRSLDWSRTSLGSVAVWPESLRTAAATVVGAAFPMILLWGPELVQIYNDGYAPFLAAKHPDGLGQRTQDCWPEVWHINAPIYERVRAGETVALTDAHFPVRRHGPKCAVEDLYITLSYSPVRDGDGRVRGVLITLIDTTAERERRTAQAERDELAARLHGTLLDSALVLDQVRDAYLLMDAEFRIVALNESAERVLARSRDELVGRTHWDAFPASVGAEPERQYRRVVTEGVEAHFVHHFVGEGYDAHLEIDAYPTSAGGVAVFWRDVTERRRWEAEAEEARVEAEARAATLAAVIESMPDAVIVAQRDAAVIANHAAVEHLGVPLTGTEDALALAALLLDRATGEPLPVEATPIGHALSGARSHGHFLLRARDTTGQPRPVRAAAAPIIGPNGKITGIVTVLTDMTAVQRAAAERDGLLAELEAERTLLRTVLDQLPAAVFVVEAPSGRVLALNSAVASVWGEPRPLTAAIEHYSREWLGYHIDGRRIASEEWPVARAARGETVTDWTGEIERADGSRALIEVNAAPVRNARGNTIAAVAIAIDITARAQQARERERLLHALEVERARLAYVFQRAPAFLAVLRGPTHVFELANDAYYQLIGRRDIIGKPAAEALPEIRDQGFIELVDTVLATGEPFLGREVPVLLTRTPGAEPEARFIDLAYLPLVEADGTRSGVIAHGMDVTEQVEARNEIARLLGDSEHERADAEAARMEAEAANRSKSEFLAIMSHELRTPLNAIGGYAELIEMGIRGPVTEMQRADLSRIQKSQRHLLGLINGVLNYAKVDAGAVHYEVSDVPLDEVLATCEALIAPQAQARGLALTFAGCDTGLHARADREKVQQVVLNLLSNAVKFTDVGGTVTLACAAADHLAGDGRRITIDVIDTGHGIPAGQLERVFQPFVQVDAKLTRTQEGTGLGLAISRDLARGMGGDLTVASALGAGSTFTLVLPGA